MAVKITKPLSEWRRRRNYGVFIPHWDIYVTPLLPRLRVFEEDRAEMVNDFWETVFLDPIGQLHI